MATITPKVTVETIKAAPMIFINNAASIVNMP
jgi:hypothetical protein